MPAKNHKVHPSLKNKAVKGEISFGFATNNRHYFTPLGQVTQKIRAMLIYTLWTPVNIPCLTWIRYPCILSCWLNTAHRLPMLTFSRHGSLPDLSTAAGPLSRHLVVLFRDTSQKSTGEPLPPCGLIQNQQINFASFFSTQHVGHLPVEQTGLTEGWWHFPLWAA